MNANNASSSLTATSTLRPRTKRLISGLSEGDETATASFDSPPRRIASPVPSPFESRSASPIPAAHPQRAGANNAGTQRFAGNSWGRRAQVGQGQRTPGIQSLSANSPNANPLAGIWGSSWTTLQGIASDFLGNDVSDSTTTVKGKQKRPLGKPHSQRAAGPSTWGPPTPTSHPATSNIGSGTKQEREAALRAQKRKDMLTRQDSSYADALGKFKRRLSDDHESMSAPPGENDNRDALVYLHHVSKDDTLAGITIKYNCSANVLRKANRMWPSDTVQSRQTLVLPVDACGIKGKPVPGAEALDLLSPENDAFQAEEVPTPTPIPPLPNGSPTRARTDSLSTDTSRRASSSVARSTTDSEAPWHHDSWVLLPNNKDNKPTEIARLSRRALGYFPPARRKSNCFSDLDTPSTSLDLHRPDQPQRPRRTRRLSNADNGYFPSYLAGPGGVGTMKSNVHFPGPAQDGLNKMFAKHLPDVAPPRNQVDLYQPEIPLYTDEPASGYGSGFGSGAVTPSYPHSSRHVTAENVGGAIESWVRKMVKPSEQKRQQRAPRPRASVGTPGRGAGGVGDLIEMTDEFEIGGDDEDDDGNEDDEEERRGRHASVVFVGEPPGMDHFGGEMAKGRSGERGPSAPSVPGGAGGGGRKSGKND